VEAGVCVIPFFPTHKVTILRDAFDATNDNGFGGAVDTSTVYTNLLCSIYDASGNQAVVYGGDQSTAVGTARFFSGITLQEGDTIRVANEPDREITRVFTRRTGANIPFRIDCEWRRVVE